MATRKPQPIKPATVAGTPDDPTGAPITFEVDGVTYTAEWDFNALAIAEKLTGTNLFLTVLDFSRVNATQFRALLFAAISKHHPGITLEAAGLLITPKTIRVITNALLRAWADVQPDEIEDGGDKPVNPPNPEAA